MISKGGNYCPIHKSWIDDKLVKIKKPDCIKEQNGCGNCAKSVYRVVLTTQKGTKIFHNGVVIDDI